ncbi:hypothetical protein Pcinc_015350 [Petrolisthes cinctipes]|uniref:Uncharacterized protein n=1 Tax=Petrolisthes cinctipes TaxID=88211 RepID=A0AAE1KSA7_PETCI|nr:hypothetical protein Pcinc_015350 [Petrolisthes cinctipes]
MSQRGSNRPRSWCPRGDSPMRLPDGSPNLPSPVAAPGIQGLPPAVASPRSTPTPFKLRRFSMGSDRAGSPCTGTPSPATVLPALHKAAAQLEQHQQRQAAQHAVAQAAQHAASQAASQIEQITTQLSQQQQQQQQTHMFQQQQPTKTQMTPDLSQQQSGVFYPMPQHPGSPPPGIHKDFQRSFRQSPLLLPDTTHEPRSPPPSRPSSIAFRERDTWSPTPSPSRAASTVPRDQDPRSPTPVMPLPLLPSERDASSPHETRLHPLTQRQRSSASPGPRKASRPRPTSLRLPGLMVSLPRRHSLTSNTSSLIQVGDLVTRTHSHSQGLTATHHHS